MYFGTLIVATNYRQTTCISHRRFSDMALLILLILIVAAVLIFGDIDLTDLFD